MEDYIVPYGLAPQACATCSATSQLLRCGSCKVVSYCTVAHQSAHRPQHKAACAAIKKSREALEREEAALRAHPANTMFLPEDVFQNGVGHFWGIVNTRDYMRARLTAANALLEVETVCAVEKALEHLTDMLRLCRSDNLGVRDLIPTLLLRLGREQDCYDFLKWWAIIAHDDHYDWADVTLPYLNIRGADAFESIDIFRSAGVSLSHLVALTLLKLRLRLDLMPFEDSDFDFGINGGYTELDRPIGMLVQEKTQSFDGPDISMISEELKEQYLTLCRLVNHTNPHFWPLLVDEGNEPYNPPPYYSPGSKEEASLVLHQCKRAWEESEDAIIMIDADTAKFTSVYTGPATVTPAGNARPERPTETAKVEEIRRGVGDAFPSRFVPPLSTSYPPELFPPTPLGRRRIIRFVYRNDQAKGLVYADGACANNGKHQPQAGWAVVYGPSDGDEESKSCTLSRRLEKKGPFGDESEATSNRAELRATIACLRLCDWRSEGFNSIVIATDSSYVVDGATSWARGWMRNGWKTRNGGNVKNRDLWELLLGEVERWKKNGLVIELWKIPRELNGAADAAAKKASHDKAVELEFRNAAISPSLTVAGENQTTPRILALCLEHNNLFEDLHADLLTSINSKVGLERATTPEAAISLLSGHSSPSVILVADGALTRHTRIWERVIDHLRGGAVVVLAGLFSSMVNRGQFDRFFAKLGLSWEQGSYHRTTVSLQRGIVGGNLTRLLPSEYCPKAVFVKNVGRSATWYASGDSSSEAAVVFADVGNGKLGYAGDVNGEESSNTVILAMCGLLT